MAGMKLGGALGLARRWAYGPPFSHAGAPNALAEHIIAAMVLLPEGLAALRAVRGNRLHINLNLAWSLHRFA